MRELALCGTRLAPAAIASLDRAISVGGPLFRLQRLSLASCRLGDAGARRLCLPLRYCAALAALDLSHNQIGPAGAEMVAGLLIPEGGEEPPGAGGAAESRGTLSGGVAGGGEGDGDDGGKGGGGGGGDDGGGGGGDGGVLGAISVDGGARHVDAMEIDQPSPMDVDATNAPPEKPLHGDSANGGGGSANGGGSAKGGCGGNGGCGGGGDGGGSGGSGLIAGAVYSTSPGGIREPRAAHRLSTGGLGAPRRLSDAGTPHAHLLSPDTLPPAAVPDAGPHTPIGRPKLRMLDMSCNPLGAAGVEALGFGLRRNSTLRHLTLRYVNANPPQGNAR